MQQTTTHILILAGFVATAGACLFGFVSTREGEKRAARVSFSIALACGVLFALAGGAPDPIKRIFLVLLGFICFAAIVLFLIPLGRTAHGKDIPRHRHDERDIMFARARLIPDSSEYAGYYSMRPEHKAGDDLTRSKPGLLSPKARMANPFHFASSEGSFGLTESLRHAVDGPVQEIQKELPSDRMTAYVKGLAKYYGALDVGIAEIQPYHVYSHTGRGTGTYGAPITVRHPYGIAFTVEMDFHMIAANPTSPGVMESARQYVEAARVAVQLANALRYLGYSARAHIDGNYQVIAPLVARDAGLGEIGRMGILMTPSHGPRVRLGVVTTDAALIPDRRRRRISVIDFCRICKKCADNCPSRSIPFGDREEIEGALRWRIDAEGCFRYWCVVGTDCGVCMTVCPYSHPSTFSHNLIRWAIDKSGFARRLAYRLDDIFYGARPSPRRAPDWTRVS
jgi:ferredoxin